MRSASYPDEHWQANEVAHSLAFGAAAEPAALLTWEWLEAAEIRGWAHPAIFAVLYRLLALAGLDSRWLVAWGPRMLQCVFAAVGDVGVGELGGPLAQKLQITNWFLAFCLPRTFSNSLETVVFTWALVLYLPRRNPVGAFLLGGLTLLLRPTAAVMLIPVGLHHLFVRKGSLFAPLPGALLFLVSSLLIDRIGYGHWVLVPLNFFRINALDGVSSFYGVHPWWWYLVVAGPYMLGAHIVPFAAGLWVAGRRHALLLSTILFTTLVYSLNPHKEYRFLLPLVPLAMVVAADGFPRTRRWLPLPALLALSLVPWVTLSLLVRTAPDATMAQLAAMRPHSVLFLTNCHHLPFAAHLHGVGVQSLRQLDCAPTSPSPGEAVRFASDPAEFIRTNLGTPSHVVVYGEGDPRWPVVGPALKSMGYTEHSRQQDFPAAFPGIHPDMVILARDS